MTSCHAALGPFAGRNGGAGYSGAWAPRTAEYGSLAVVEWNARLFPRDPYGTKGRAPLAPERVVIVGASEPYCALQSYTTKVLKGLLDRAAAPPPSRTGGLCVDAALEDKARADGAYGEFVDVVSSACSSPGAGSLGMTECALSEESDPDNPSWIKLILRIEFADGDFDSKRGRRIKLRGILNERIRAAKIRSATPERVDEIARRFFIIVSW